MRLLDKYENWTLSEFDDNKIEHSSGLSISLITDYNSGTTKRNMLITFCSSHTLNWYSPSSDIWHAVERLIDIKIQETVDFILVRIWETSWKNNPF
jgi:hypothetical protein